MRIDDPTLIHSILQVLLLVLSGTPAYQKIKQNQTSTRDTLARIETTMKSQFDLFEMRLHNLEMLAYSNNKPSEKTNANTAGNPEQHVNRLTGIIHYPSD